MRMKFENRMSEDVFTYRVDKTDKIVGVSDNFYTFAEKNDWHGHWRPEDVIGHSLWDFIQDRETRHLYQELFRRVRKGKRCRAIPFRCDSPDERRFLELILEALPDHQIAITSKIVRTEHRNRIRLLDAGTSRSTDHLIICSMCKKIEVSPQHWAEIEEGLVQLRLFEAHDMPLLSHGVCPECYQVAMRELDDSGTPKNGIDKDEEKNATSL
jgi:hypothetical protein